MSVFLVAQLILLEILKYLNPASTLTAAFCSILVDFVESVFRLIDACAVACVDRVDDDLLIFLSVFSVLLSVLVPSFLSFFRLAAVFFSGRP